MSALWCPSCDRQKSHMMPDGRHFIIDLHIQVTSAQLDDLSCYVGNPNVRCLFCFSRLVLRDTPTTTNTKGNEMSIEEAAVKVEDLTLSEFEAALEERKIVNHVHWRRAPGAIPRQES